MDCKDLKKILAGLGVASLISSGGAILPGAHAASSGWTAKPNAGSVEKVVKKAVPTGWSGDKDGAVSTVEDEAKKAADVEEDVKDKVKKKAAESGWSAKKDSAVSTAEDEAKKAADVEEGVKDKVKKVAPSGWSGSK